MALLESTVHTAITTEAVGCTAACNVCRGGPGASTHVELLGNELMLTDLLSIVSGNGESLEEQYHSDIRRIADRIPWDNL